MNLSARSETYPGMNTGEEEVVCQIMAVQLREKQKGEETLW